MKLKRLLVVASAFSSALFLSACATTPDGTQERVTTDSLLQGGEWVVEDLGGKGIIDSSYISIVFMDENRVGGSSSCNRYSGEYQLSGSGFTVGDNMASTRMVCPPALMNQEDYFLTLLMNVNQARWRALDETAIAGQSSLAFGLKYSLVRGIQNDKNLRNKNRTQPTACAHVYGRKGPVGCG